MADKLSIYNAALRRLGQTRLTSLSEDVKSRRLLDQSYDEVLASCLEGGWWNFALRSARLDYNSSIEPYFGRDRVFDFPDDWVRTYSLCSDEYFTNPVLDFQVVGRQWLCDLDEIYVQWISDGAEYGNDLGKWPRSYTQFVEWSLAVDVCEGITGSDNRLEVLLQMQKKAKADARNLDAMNDPVTRFPPKGRWERSRMGGSLIRGEGRYRAG